MNRQERRSAASMIFDFAWTPADELMALIVTPEGIADGVVERIIGKQEREGIATYFLRISTKFDMTSLSQEQMAELAVKVCV